MRCETGWGGERVCVSHYMKDNVHERLEVIRPNWPREEDYLSLVGTQTWKYNLKMLFKGIWSPRGLRRGL